MSHMNELGTFKALLEKELGDYRPARENLYDFIRVTKPDMQMNWFHEELCRELQQFYYDVLAGKQPRLILEAPPRHGKTELVSRRFPAWAFGKNPNTEIVACSYAAMLSMRTNRDIQRIMDDPTYHAIFDGTRLNTENIATVSGKPLRNSEIFEIVGHKGSYRAAGVGQGITGMGFTIGIIDDPIADAKEAFSETVRQGIWEWYQTTFYTRQAPNAGIVVIMTRWHEDDLVGRLLEASREEEGEQWRVVRYSAIAEEDEAHRKAGEALQPERYPVDRLNKIKRAVGSYSWAALYQQRPQPKGGTIFKRGDWKYWKVLPELDEIILSIDATFKDLQTSDYVAIQAWGTKGANRYLLRRMREQMGFSATVDAVRTFKGLFPTANAVLIEDKANGSAVIETLQKEIPGVIAINPEGGKIARAFAVQPTHEAGNLFLPDVEVDPAIETFIAETAAFPGGKHDDETDAMTQAINYLHNRGDAMGLFAYYRKLAEEAREREGTASPMSLSERLRAMPNFNRASPRT